MGFGRCAFQHDDADRDGVGDVCDLCPNGGASSVTANSNVDAERRKGVVALGDQCEPVPQLVSKGIVGLIDEVNRTPSGPLSSTATYTTFMGTAGFGTGGSRTSIPAERAGYRYCDCIDQVSAVQNRAACLSILCPVTDMTYDLDVSYHMVTTATLPGITQLPTRGTGVLGEEFVRTFTQTIRCNDPFEHRSFPEIDPGSGQCRVGDQQQITLWEHDRDSLRRVNGKSAGLFLSHVLRTTGITGGSSTGGVVRDDTLGLRDTLEYVETPLVDIIPPAPVPPNIAQACQFAGCKMTWRPDWAWFPVDFYTPDPNPIDFERNYGQFVLLPTNDITILTRAQAVARTSSPMPSRTTSKV